MNIKDEARKVAEEINAAVNEAFSNPEFGGDAVDIIPPILFAFAERVRADRDFDWLNQVDAAEAEVARLKAELEKVRNDLGATRREWSKSDRELSARLVEASQRIAALQLKNRGQG